MVTKSTNEIAHWLEWQCQMISEVDRGGVFLAAKDAESTTKTLALWPSANNHSSTLEKIATKTIKDGAGIAQKSVVDGANVFDYVSQPLIQNNHVVGAVVLAIATRSDQQRQAVLLLLQWGTAFMEKILARDHEQDPEADALALNAVSLFSRNEPLAVAGYHLCNLLADSFDCSRVVLGLRSGLQVRVLSMSHQLQFDRRIVRVNKIEFAMEECIEQHQNIILPAASPDTNGMITNHAQQLLSDNNGSVCLIPLRSGDAMIGVISLVSDKNNRFDKSTVELLTKIADNIAPVISLNVSNTKPLWKKMLHAINTHLKGLVGAGHLRFKLIVASCIIAFALLTLLQTDHIITATASVEGKTQQAIVAPFDSYISTASARAGDSVDKDQVLATLDDRELLLEHDKWSSERDKQAKEYQQALAVRDRAQVSILIARIAQTDSQLHSVEEKLQHTQLRSPFSGLLVSGDWNQSLGTPIERGQLMFEVIPAKNYRITLHVDELDVAGLSSGQNASLRLTGLPEQSIQLRISRILPIASVTQGSNNFRVESEIVDPPQGLRPGMQGVAKIVVGRGSLLTVWTHSLLTRLRLWAWSLGF